MLLGYLALARRGSRIRGPWPARSRIAVLRPWFPVTGHCRVFEEIHMDSLARYRPGAVAGCVAALRELASEALRARESGSGVQMPPLRHGTIALTATGRPSLSGDDRELFWRAFRVPVYEQCRCADGTLYAEECAAHDGLHLRVEAEPIGLEHAALLYAPCACGDSAPRIVPAMSLPHLVDNVPRHALASFASAS